MTDLNELAAVIYPYSSCIYSYRGKCNFHCITFCLDDNRPCMISIVIFEEALQHFGADCPTFDQLRKISTLHEISYWGKRAYVFFVFYTSLFFSTKLFSFQFRRQIFLTIPNSSQERKIRFLLILHLIWAIYTLRWLLENTLASSKDQLDSNIIF